MIMLTAFSASAYDVVDLPNSMTFADAIGIFGADEIASASVCDINNNTYKNLTETEISNFYNTAADLTVWRF